MKNSSKMQFASVRFIPMFLIVLFGASCKKDSTVTPVVTTAVTISGVTTDATTLSDVETLSCQLPDTISVTNAPANVGTYLSTIYPSATLEFIFTVKAAGNTTGFVANILNGAAHTAVRFDATGNFVKTIVMPAHTGLAMFQTDTVAVSTVPAPLTAYLKANSTTYNVQRIFQESDSSFTIIATQPGAATFVMSYSNATPTALNITNVGMADFTTPNPDLSTLPATIASYIAQNYGSATIERVLVENCTGASNGYTIILKQNTTTIAVEFDATGNFMETFQAQ